MMKFTTHNNDDIQTGGTSFQGYCPAGVTFDMLQSIFGISLDPSSDGKVRYEWNIKFEDGQVATIYDWKDCRPKENLTGENVWHIGGKSPEVVCRIEEILIGEFGNPSKIKNELCAKLDELTEYAAEYCWHQNGGEQKVEELHNFRDEIKQYITEN